MYTLERVKEIKLKEIDFKIIKELNEDTRISITDLSEKIGVSRQTIVKRINHLKNEGILITSCGFNLKKLGYKMAMVGLGVKSGESRTMLENILVKCPRVHTIYRTPNKANILVELWGEDDQTINSTIESFRDLTNVDIVQTDYLGTPIHGEKLISPKHNNAEITPCEMNCSTCHRYNNLWCKGCPVTIHYKDPLKY
jgi:DNA-binding Lrp family transcriptional regulator